MLITDQVATAPVLTVSKNDSGLLRQSGVALVSAKSCVVVDDL